jgi:hypothetical protein
MEADFVHQQQGLHFTETFVENSGQKVIKKI